jgi:hypothetical protein
MKLSRRSKIFLTFLVAASVAAGFVLAYYLGQIPGTVTVQEPITWTPTSFDVTMYAGETKNQTITVNNAASVDINVNVITTSNSPSNVTVSAPASVVVPASGSFDFNVTMTASPSAVPATYTVTVDVSR